MYHYTESGLRNIWLRNGYAEHKTAYGLGTSIEDVEGLHRAIGFCLVTRKPQLTGSEVRFLRIELSLSQIDLARVLGVSENSVRGWENHRTRITRPAERLLRVLYLESIKADGLVRELLDKINQLNRDAHAAKLEMEHDAAWKEAA